MWGLAVSDSRARVMFYRSTAPNGDGLPSQLSDIEPVLWDSFVGADREAVKLAWATAVSQRVDQSLTVTAARNGLRCRLSLFPVPQNEMVSFTRWAPAPNVTSAELDVCLRAVEGQTAKQIAAELGTTIQSVNKHKRSAMERLGCETAEQLGACFAAWR